MQNKPGFEYHQACQGTAGQDWILKGWFRRSTCSDWSQSNWNRIVAGKYHVGRFRISNTSQTSDGLPVTAWTHVARYHAWKVQFVVSVWAANRLAAQKSQVLSRARFWPQRAQCICTINGPLNLVASLHCAGCGNKWTRRSTNDAILVNGAFAHASKYRKKDRVKRPSWRCVEYAVWLCEPYARAKKSSNPIQDAIAWLLTRFSACFWAWRFDFFTSCK